VIGFPEAVRSWVIETGTGAASGTGTGVLSGWATCWRLEFEADGEGIGEEGAFGVLDALDGDEPADVFDEADATGEVVFPKVSDVTDVPWHK
jgi:hypothetical protein